jgi:hypothetical protein
MTRSVASPCDRGTPGAWYRSQQAILTRCAASGMPQERSSQGAGRGAAHEMFMRSRLSAPRPASAP